MKHEFIKTLATAAIVCGMSFGAASAQEGIDLVNGQTKFDIDPHHATVLLAWNHVGMSTTYAVVREFEGTLDLDPAKVEDANLSVSLKLGSLDTMEQKRTEDLQGPRFFNVANFPTATFKSTSVKRTSDTTADVTGDFTLLGQTKPLTLKVKYNKASKNKDKLLVGFDAETVITRADYGVATLAPMVGPEVTVKISTELLAAAK
ncbi:YceI family protein [Sinorhizobium mexicanum]|uniref:YceI family protein n=1 Tax=Sinorhizobium mexicanum TaxID=375549 RepID=UPI0015DF9D50|nr:YceI family protein [Sinorhizobium mexicanum]MBP1884348.1 polyisoprenoid-binding protein YceI [Sinorhizobium mexicanum]